MRSRRRTGPLPHVLVAGDLAEIGSIQSLLCLLPQHAYGQIYLEVPAGADVPDLPRPARVGLTAFVRDADDAPGARLSSAVIAWSEEWAADEHDHTRDVSAWVGNTVALDCAPMNGSLARL